MRTCIECAWYPFGSDKPCRAVGSVLCIPSDLTCISFIERCLLVVWEEEALRDMRGVKFLIECQNCMSRWVEVYEHPRACPRCRDELFPFHKPIREITRNDRFW